MPEPLTWNSGLAWDNHTPWIEWDGFVTSTSPKRPMTSGNRISLEITEARRRGALDHGGISWFDQGVGSLMPVGLVMKRCDRRGRS
jgi:hypothetical protein